MSKGTRDHYVPQFYLSRWAEDDEKLARCEIIPHTRKLHWKRVSPKEIAFEHGLYGELEEAFFKPLDNDASRLLQLLDSERCQRTVKFEIGHDNHRLWAKYLLAQMIRTPKNLSRLLDLYSMKGINKDIAIEQLPLVIENEKAMNDLRSFEWLIAGSECNRQLITCDYPLIFRPDDLGNERCVLILPLGPHSYFMATRRQNLSAIESDNRKMFGYINQEIMKNAKGRFFASSKSSVNEGFITKYFSNQS